MNIEIVLSGTVIVRRYLSDWVPLPGVSIVVAAAEGGVVTETTYNVVEVERVVSPGTIDIEPSEYCRVHVSAAQ